MKSHRVYEVVYEYQVDYSGNKQTTHGIVYFRGKKPSNYELRETFYKLYGYWELIKTIIRFDHWLKDLASNTVSRYWRSV